MPQTLFATIFILSQVLFSTATGEISFVPTILTNENQIEATYLPVEMPKLPIAREAYPTKTDTKSLGPDITATSAISIDFETGLTLWQKNPNTVQPIASLSKLMTALVLMDLGIDWTQRVEVNGADNSTEGARLRIPNNTKVSLEDLLRAVLVGSANNATMSLVTASGLSEIDFVALMNQKAVDLDLENTFFDEPTGLSAKNVSTVNDYAKVISAAFKNDKIRKTTLQASHQMETDSGQFVKIYNTNKLINNTFLKITGTKTGFTPEAGYCLTLLTHDDVKDASVLTLVLGSYTDKDRQIDSEILQSWTYNNYTWPNN